MDESNLIKPEDDGDESDLSVHGKSEIVPVDSKSLPVALKEKITATLANITDTKIVSVISELANTCVIAKEATKFIKKESTYIARIPKKLQADMQKGLLDFMHDKKTGENLGMLVNDKHKMKGYLRIDEVRSVDIAANLANIALQQQLAQMTEVLNDVRSRVIAIQEGLDNDLFGSVKGMHNQLMQIRDAVKKPDIQKHLAIQAITVLNQTRGKIEMTILSALKDIQIVPGTDWAVLRKIALNKDFLTDTIEKYDRIEELFSYYVTATQLLGYSYAFLDESFSYEDIFKPSKELIENENLQKLIAAEFLYEEPVGETWYKNPDKYLLAIETASNNLFIEDSDFIEIEITGENLLEAIGDGQDSTDENGQEEVSDG